MKSTQQSLSPSELEVMKELWDAGPSSIREIHDRIKTRSGWAYSTTKTVMDRMVGKEILKRSEFHGVFLYEPRISRAQGLAVLVRDFAERVLEVDSQAMVPLFAESGSMSPEELKELEGLLGEADES